MNSFQFFEPNSLLFLIPGLFLLAFSIGFFEIGSKTRLSLVLLFLSALFTCIFSAGLDPFLNIWDEQFHALVAKNILAHPFSPVLYEHPVIGYDFINWTANHIWLHKQPLFLWQIALSIKLFGVNEFAVRIPSIMMMSIIPLLIYRIGKISICERAGYYAAVLFGTSYFAHDIVSGFMPSDHNDVAFLFYITASIWAWVEYERSKKGYWIVLIGVFSGCAVLVKWLTGLLVFAGWGIAVLSDKEKRASFHSYKDIALSFGVCLLIFIPWQLHILAAFPLESAYEYSLNSRHFTKVIEDHGGNSWYYFNNLSDQYGSGDMVPYLILLSLFFFYKNIKTVVFKAGFITFIVVVYAFFTLAATKMISFCFIVSPFIFLSLASMIASVFEFIRKKLKRTLVFNSIIVISLMLIAWGNLDLHQIAHKHTMFIDPNDNDKRIEKINDAVFIRSLKDKLPSQDYVLFNCKPRTNISIMFYTGLTAYDQPLDHDNYILLKNKKIKLAVIDNGTLPDYIRNDSTVVKIKAPDRTW